MLKRSRLLGGVISFCFLMLSMPVQASAAQPAKLQLPGIKGHDDRIVADSTLAPWRSIGRINKDGGHCTGVLVGPDKVLTAAHCFWNKRTRRWSDAKFFHFLPGYSKGSYAAHAKGIRYTLARGTKEIHHFDDLKREEDWAILTIDQPLGDKLGWFEVDGVKPVESRVQGLEIFQAGYSRDYAHVLTTHPNCRIREVAPLGAGNAGLYFHDCDATKGDSGSPLFRKIGESYRIVGLHSSTQLRMGGGSFGVGVPSYLFKAYINK